MRAASAPSRDGRSAGSWRYRSNPDTVPLDDRSSPAVTTGTCEITEYTSPGSSRIGARIEP